jgi:CRP-like cAMP-binding protein
MSEPGELLAFLKNVALLAGLSEVSLARMAGLCHVKNAPRGFVIFSRGDLAEAFYLVRAGLIAEFAGSRGSDVEVFIKERRPGDFFGEMAILLDEPELVTVMAVRDSALVVIRREHFLKLVDSEPSVASFLMRTFARRVKASGEQQVTHTLLQAPARLAYIVLRLEQEEGGHGTISVTQDYLAQRCSLARQTAARVLGEWRRAGWIVTNRGRIEIKDRAAISRVLETISAG